MKKIQIPEFQCGDCQFFNVGEDPVGFCLLYDRSWDMDGETNEFWHDNNSPKPEFCKAETVTVNETPI